MSAQYVFVFLNTRALCIEGVVVKTWKRAHSIEIGVASALFNNRKTPFIPPSTSNRSFEIAILFSVVDFLIENIFLRRTLPHNPRSKGFKLYPEGI
jgi:hypothetical protein